MSDVRTVRFESLSELMQAMPDIEKPHNFLAGGTDLMVLLKSDLIHNRLFIDISDIPELKGIREKDGQIIIGAGATHYEIMRDPLLKRYAPALVEACSNIGGPQIRVRGTVGGNIDNASPAGDTVSALYSLDAKLELVSPRGSRIVDIDDYIVSPRRTVRAVDELILNISFPVRANSVGAWVALGQRKAMAISKISLAITAVPRVPGSLESGFDYLRLAYGAVGPKVLRAPKAEAILMDGFTEQAIAKACEVVTGEVTPISDIRSTQEYRRAMSAVLLSDCLAKLA